jgi:hypothetical protein
MSNKTSKKTTAIGNGIDTSITNTMAIAPPLRTAATTGSRNPHYEGETDSETSLMNTMDGVGHVNGTKLGQKYGWVSPTGSSLLLDSNAGGDALQLTHHSGATVRIDPDGAVYLTSSSAKGVGISAPFGDAYMDASGDIAIKGSSLSFNTSGDATFNVGGTFNIAADSYKLSTNVMDEVIDGTASRSVTNDSSEIVGGIKRSTVAGDRMHQTSGNQMNHVGGNKNTYVTGNQEYDITGQQTVTAKGAATYSSEGNQSFLSQGEGILSAKSTLTVVSDADSIIDGNNVQVRSKAVTAISGGTHLVATSDSTTVSAEGAIDITGGSSAKVSAPVSSMHGATVTIGTGTLLAPTPTGSPSISILAPATILSAGDAYDVEGPEEAIIIPPEDIVDELTSVRKYPEFPNNAKRQSADGGGIYTVSHDQTNSAEAVYKEYSSKNYGSANPVSTESYGTIPEVSAGERKENITSVDPGISVPTRGNSSSKISRYFTLGQIINAKHSHKIPTSIYDQIVSNHIFAAYNVLDPIKEKFPDLIITSAYRSNSSNHRTGYAIDMVVASRSLEVHAEIARFARDNLPVDQVYLEKNTSGRTHVHLRATRVNATPKTLTCGDPACKSRTGGISIEYLRRRGVR